MNPLQKNKVDISNLSADEQRIFRMYGKLPNTKDLLQNKLQERKYFDSGDYAMSKAGKTTDGVPTQIGRDHPNPETIPHLSSTPVQQTTPNLAPPQGQNHSGSPVKESSILQREVSVDDVETPEKKIEQQDEEKKRTGDVPDGPPEMDEVPVQPS